LQEGIWSEEALGSYNNSQLSRRRLLAGYHRRVKPWPNAVSLRQTKVVFSEKSQKIGPRSDPLKEVLTCPEHGIMQHSEYSLDRTIEIIKDEILLKIRNGSWKQVVERLKSPG
jgi:hypothetical protein